MTNNWDTDHDPFWTNAERVSKNSIIFHDNAVLLAPLPRSARDLAIVQGSLFVCTNSRIVDLQLGGPSTARTREAGASFRNFNHQCKSRDVAGQALVGHRGRAFPMSKITTSPSYYWSIVFLDWARVLMMMLRFTLSLASGSRGK